MSTPTLSLGTYGVGGVGTVTYSDIPTSGPLVAFDSGTIVVASLLLVPQTHVTVQLARFNINGAVLGSGSVDLTAGFGFSIQSHTAAITDMAITYDRKILVAYYVYRTFTSTAQSIVVARFNTNGTLDTTFASGTGTYTRSIPTTPIAPPITLSPIYDGAFVTAFLDTSSTIYFERVSEDGVTATGSSSTTTTSAQSPNASLTQPDGNVLIANPFGAGVQLWRRLGSTATLDPDPSFGVGGSVTWSDGAFASVPTNLGMDSAGMIYVGLRFTANNFFGVVRFTQAGVLDVGFGVGGLATGSNNKSATGLSFLNSGGMVAIGGTPAGSGTQAIGFGSSGAAGTLFSPALGSIGAWVSICSGTGGSLFAASRSGSAVKVTKIDTDNGGTIPPLVITNHASGQAPVGQDFTGTSGVPAWVTGWVTGDPYISSAHVQVGGQWNLPNTFPAGPTVYTLNVARFWTSRRCNVNTTTTFTVFVCLHGDSLIKMSEGNARKRIKDIVPGDSVLGADGVPHRVKDLAVCWLKDPSKDIASRAAVIEPGALGEGSPSERLIIDIGHPLAIREQFQREGLQSLRPFADVLAGREFPGGSFAIVRWDEVWRWAIGTDTEGSGESTKRYDLILEGEVSAYIANGVAVLSRKSQCEPGYVHDSEEI